MSDATDGSALYVAAAQFSCLSSSLTPPAPECAVRAGDAELIAKRKALAGERRPVFALGRIVIDGALLAQTKIPEMTQISVKKFPVRR